jgi:hypothetical protein
MLFSLSNAKFKINDLRLKNGENINIIKKARIFSILLKIQSKMIIQEFFL